jgi:hypothetical protein
MKIAGSGSESGSGSICETPKCHISATLKNTVNSTPEGGDGHGAAHVEVFIEPEAEMSLAGAHHET